jgi:hypothetical protein
MINFQLGQAPKTLGVNHDKLPVGTSSQDASWECTLPDTVRNQAGKCIISTGRISTMNMY